MSDMHTEDLAALRLAISDPGKYVRRGDPQPDGSSNFSEPLVAWQARAVWAAGFRLPTVARSIRCVFCDEKLPIPPHGDREDAMRPHLPNCRGIER